MIALLSTLAVAFAAFCVWLVVRIVIRSERWTMLRFYPVAAVAWILAVVSDRRAHSGEIDSIPPAIEALAVYHHPIRVMSLAISPHDDLLAAGTGGEKEGEIQLWNLNTGSTSDVLKGHAGYVYSLSFSSREPILASASFDRTVRVWKLPKGEQFQYFDWETCPVYSITFSPDGKMLASAIGSTIRLQSTTDWRELRSVETRDTKLSALSFSRDGRFLASGGMQRIVEVWNPASGEAVATLAPQANSVCSLAFATTPGILAVGGNLRDKVEQWNSLEQTLMPECDAGVGGGRAVAYSPDGTLLAIAASDHIDLFESQTGKPKARLKGHRLSVTSIAFFHDGTKIASGSWDKTVRIWSLDRVARIKEAQK